MARRGGVGTQPGLPIEEATTIPASWYFDAEHHREEVGRVFARTWQQVARAEQLRNTGDHVVSEVAGEPMVAVRGRDGKLRAFHNVCRHRAGVVVRGHGCSKAWSCTYHGWTYGLDGALLAAPEMEGVRNFDKREFGLVPVSCDSWGPYVFVNLDHRAPPLLEALGSLPRLAGKHGLHRMPFGCREVYTVACNWKVYIDNYLEGYHIPKAHPGLHKVIDYRRYTVTHEGNAVTQGAPDRARGSRADSEGYLYLWLFPNFMVNLSPDYAQTNLIVPMGPETTSCIFDYYFEEKAGKAEARRRKKSIAWSDEIQREDIWLCEAVQKNLHSRSYSTGRYSAKREGGVHHFHEMLRRMLGAPAPDG